jgi:Tfp pilus assembly ATPase PilU
MLAMVFDLQRIIEFWPEDKRFRAFGDIGLELQARQLRRLKL